jgi:hypothetical protein
MPDNKDEQVTITMPRKAWDVVLYLAIRGGKEALDIYIKGHGHTANCMVENANVVKDLHDQLHPEAALHTLDPDSDHIH